MVQITVEQKQPGVDWWEVQIDGQGIGNGSERQCRNLADELPKLSVDELVELRETMRKMDAVCPHCGHEGRNHDAAPPGKCYKNAGRSIQPCACPGWIPE